MVVHHEYFLGRIFLTYAVAAELEIYALKQLNLKKKHIKGITSVMCV